LEVGEVGVVAAIEPGEQAMFSVAFSDPEREAVLKRTELFAIIGRGGIKRLG
jgi:hypothetical protein